MKLDGEVAIVTGSSRGIGRAIAIEFAREGANVVVDYRVSDADGGKVVADIEKIGSSALAVKADVSDAKQVENLVQTAIKKFGKIDILVNNAGYISKKVWHAKLSDVTEELWNSVMNVDLKGTFLCSKAVSSIMMKQKRGKILNVSSTPALTGDVYGFAYSVAKAGILGMTKSLARILAPHVQVNAMALGSIETGWIDWLSPKEIQDLINETAQKRFGKPQEVADLAVFLASRDSDYITGQTIVVDGGYSMH